MKITPLTPVLTAVSTTVWTILDLFTVKSKAVGYNNTVWVSIYQIPLLRVLDKTSIFCNILSLSNWQMDVSPETIYWQPNVVEERGSQDRDQRPEETQTKKCYSWTLVSLWHPPQSPLRPNYFTVYPVYTSLTPELAAICRVWDVVKLTTQRRLTPLPLRVILYVISINRFRMRIYTESVGGG